MTPLQVVVLLALTATPCCLAADNLWVDNAEYKLIADKRHAVSAPVVQVNLDLSPEERWASVAPQFKNESTAFINYLKSEIPGWAIPVLEKAAAHLISYRGWGDEYAGEMRGVAKALDMDLGEIVVANLIYQLEHIGINCSAWNTTGPCPAKDNEPMFPFRRTQTTDGPQGYCTSVVSDDSTNSILHGRNLDWNLPQELRQFAVTVEYTRGNKTVFYGTQFVGFIGTLNGMHPDGFSISLDARGRGGIIVENLFEAITQHGATPAQHIRTALETRNTFDDAVAFLGTGNLVDDAYFIVGGTKPGEGVVIARDRSGVHSSWTMNTTQTFGWYRLETNYDYDQPVPPMDDRRTPGNTHMHALGGASGVNPDSLLDKVMKVWPTYNHHTDVTCIMRAGGPSPLYKCMWWSD